MGFLEQSIEGPARDLSWLQFAATAPWFPHQIAFDARRLNDPAGAQRMADAGYNTIQAEFSWEAIANRHLAFYDKFMDFQPLGG